jgi:hypothetical protein
MPLSEECHERVLDGQDFSISGNQVVSGQLTI